MTFYRHQSLPVETQKLIAFKVVNRLYSFTDRDALRFIIIVSVILRVLSAVYQGNSVSDLPGVYDQISYDGLARRVVDGYGFSFAEGHWPATRAGEPTAHWSYLYTLYIAAVYKLFGPYPLIARLIQAAIVGVFSPFFLWRIGSRLFGRTVGLIAAGLNAVYIYFIYYAGGLVTETMYIAGILWIFDSALRILDASERIRGDGTTKNWFHWMELGLAMGVTILLRQVFLLFLPFLYFWLWWNYRDMEIGRWRLFRSTIRGLSLATLMLALTILPFTIRNYRAFGTFVLLNTNAGFAFYWGNHPVHGTHFVPLLPVSYQDLIPPPLLELNEGKLDQALLREAIRIVVNDPVRYGLLSLSRIEEYIKFWPSKDSSLLSNISRVASFGILLPFIIHGTWISLANLRKPSSPMRVVGLTIIFQFIVVYAAIHLLSWTLIRYRLPIDAFLILFASVSIERLSRKLQPVSVSPVSGEKTMQGFDGMS
jgi:hypothetical protein